MYQNVVSYGAVCWSHGIRRQHIRMCFFRDLRAIWVDKFDENVKMYKKMLKNIYYNYVLLEGRFLCYYDIFN